MAKAGWCDACGAYVYLAGDGGCLSGHGSVHISRLYDAPDVEGVPTEVTNVTAAAAPGNSVADLIAEASRVADETVVVTRTADGSVVQTDTMSGTRLVEILDNALALSPGNPDLLIAKSDALMFAMQFKSAEDILDGILAHDPENLEARTRKEHWGEWSSVFTLPAWSEAATVLAPTMTDDLAQARSVQVVRVGVKAAIAIVRPVRAAEMAPGLGSQTRSMWEPVWSQTPLGAVFAHYVVVADDPTDPYRAEGFLPLFHSDQALRVGGYWLVRQLASADGCFIVLADGSRVLYNRWFAFPAHVKAHLEAMARELDTAAIAGDVTAFQQAVQWHSNTFDMDQVAFDRPLSDSAAGVASFISAHQAPERAAEPVAPSPIESAPTPTPEPELAPAPEPMAEPTPAPAGESTPGPFVFGDVDAILGNPSLSPQVRAVLLLELCQIAQNVAPERLDGYWMQLAQVKASLPKEHADAYNEAAQELGESTEKADTGVIPGLIAEVAAAKTQAAADRDGAARNLASIEARLGERKVPFGKKRVYAALADAWLGIDRGQTIRLVAHTSANARSSLVTRMHGVAPLTQDEWRSLATVTKPATAANLAADVIRSSEAHVDLPAELVEKVGIALFAGISSSLATPVPLPERLTMHERLVASLAGGGRCDEAWNEVSRVYNWGTIATTQQLADGGGWIARFPVLERAINEAVAHHCVSEERFAALAEETPVYLQAYVRALYRAKTTMPGAVEATYRRLEQELSPEALRRPMGYQLKHGGNPAKLADAGHRAAALRLYLARVAQGGMAQEALDLAARLGDQTSRTVLVTTLLSGTDEAARALLSAEQFPDGSVDHFLALGTVERRAEYLARVTGNGAHTIPGRLWRDMDAAQAMPQVRVGGVFSKETAPRQESAAEYIQHNPMYLVVSVNVLPEQQFTVWMDSLAEYGAPVIDAALLPALVAWSERDWEPARNAMVWMWEAIKPSDDVLLDNVLRDGIIKRSIEVLSADPEVLGSYVLPWLHQELVVKGRTWQQGNTQITLRLADKQLAAMCLSSAIALADLAPARRDRVVEIALGYAAGSPEIVRPLGQVFMAGRTAQLAEPPVPLSAASAVAWQEGVAASIVNDIKQRLLLLMIAAAAPRTEVS